ncbi:MAG: hypothetical protein LBK12_02970 [Odoribacteraceae bacterium]|jgi:hypothetical protein|nr:hypothetical protein [Odoribacteraceae bacterium]
MKKLVCISTLALLALGSCHKFDPAYLEDEVNDLKNRVAALEQAVNNNLAALQGIVAALETADYITGVTAFTSPVPGGHVISLAKGGTITISNGVAGADGNDGASPLVGARLDDDGAYYWTLDGDWILADGHKLRVTGDKGADGNDGQDGVTPQIRVNTVNNEWEISLNDGVTWTSTNAKATGLKGDKGDKGETGNAGANGDAVFAADGVDYSSPDRVVFTLADGATITVPRYQKLGLTFAQPGAFAAGETRVVEYTPEGDATSIKFLNVPAGWKITVNYTARAFTITAPATFGGGNEWGEVILLVSDNDQNVITRAIYLVTDESHVEIDGYAGNTLSVSYTDGTHVTVTKDNSFALPANHKIITSIDLEGGTSIIAGREADGSAITFKISGGNLVFRDAVAGDIPVGTYSEFQLINTALNGTYKQEADLDLLDLEWTPVGSSSSAFSGTFDGDNHALANLKISGNNDNVGLFGYISGSATIRNVHVISGSVSGKNYVGGICGWHTGGEISGCSNACLVSGSDAFVGGVCGRSLSSITSCYNTGPVSGSNSYVGGVCGSSLSSITTCYNTGAVSGNSYAGGVCGSSSSITSCYNTGPVSGSSSYVGGVCGSSISSSITSCYNTGSISGALYVGGVCGFSSSSITACYWQDIPGDNADYGIYPASNTDATIFAPGAWPTTGTDLQWGTGDGSGDGKYWKSLGDWNGGNPVYPTLWFEE